MELSELERQLMELSELERQRLLTALDSILAHCQPAKVRVSSKTRLQADLDYIHSMAVALQTRLLGNETPPSEVDPGA